MQKADRHTYQVLTKRHQRMCALLSDELRWLGGLRHVWLGVSVENRRHGIPRIAALRATPAAVHFLSIEPLLEDLGPIDLTGIDWVIVGGESGPRARPLQEQWVLSLRDPCHRAKVPFFFEQWGGVRKKLDGRMLRGCTHDQFPRMRSAGLAEAG